MSLKHCSS